MRRKIVFCLLFFGGIAFLSFVSNYYFHQSICLFHGILGIPCPTCGMTRAYMALLHGDWKAAFHFHPLFWLVPLLIYSILYSKKLFFGIAAIFVLCWMYRMYLYFPLQEPLLWNQNAILVRLFHSLFSH